MDTIPKNQEPNPKRRRFESSQVVNPTSLSVEALDFTSQRWLQLFEMDQQNSSNILIIKTGKQEFEFKVNLDFLQICTKTTYPEQKVVIKVPLPFETTPKTLQKMLRYLYCGTIEFTLEELPLLSHVAICFGLDELKSKFCTCLLENLCPALCCTLLQQFCNFNNPAQQEYIELCLQYLQIYTRDCLECASESMDHLTWQLIAKLDKIRITEEELFEFILFYVDKSGANWSYFLPLIRFKAMDIEYINEKVEPLKILPIETLLECYKHHCLKDASKMRGLNLQARNSSFIFQIPFECLEDQKKYYSYKFCFLNRSWFLEVQLNALHLGIFLHLDKQQKENSPISILKEIVLWNSNGAPVCKFGKNVYNLESPNRIGYGWSSFITSKELKNGYIFQIDGKFMLQIALTFVDEKNVFEYKRINSVKSEYNASKKTENKSESSSENVNLFCDEDLCPPHLSNYSQSESESANSSEEEEEEHNEALRTELDDLLQ